MQKVIRYLIIVGIVLALLIAGITYFHLWPYVPLALWILLHVGAVVAIVFLFIYTRGAIRYSSIAGVVVLTLLIDGIIVAAIFNAWLDILYVALIIVAAFTLIVAGMQIYTVVMLIGTISTVRDEMKPLLASVQETVGVAKETVDALQEMAKSAGQTATAIGATARFTSDFAIGPSVRVAAMLVAAQQMLRVFLGRGHTGTRADQRRKQQMDAAVGGE